MGHQTAHTLYCKHTPERVLELDVKSPELTQKKEEQQTHTLYSMSVNKHTHINTHPSRALLPNGVTSLHHPLRDAGGRFASAGTAQRSVTRETAMLCFCHQRWWQEIVCVMHLDLFWHTYNYSPHLLQEQLNVASKVLKIKINLEVSPSDDDWKWVSGISNITQ